ncbi:hypothetical protein L484_011136 [Morus notabilis]|uniref:DUF7870 domain-containing protein n=1 Tax=Morus notabilis TaxID=981085 RepID=W9RYU4_9ROSA|nr:uncharacterized protein LOC21394409 [Morus notabilis]EXB78513.1 hypothetical protein L484_011136 [Morus notabilis]
MGFAKSKPQILRIILLRFISLGVLVLAVRFAFLLTLTGGGYCCSADSLCHFQENNFFFGPTDVCLRRERFRDLWRRRAVDYYSSVFQDLIAEGFLSSNSTALCVETLAGEDVAALREIGVLDSVGISKKASPPLILSGESYRQPFDENTFDFEFSGNGQLERSVQQADFASEVCRTLKPGGFFVVHTDSVQDPYSINSFLDLFNCCRLIRFSEIDGLDSPSIREIVMKKKETVENHLSSGRDDNKCSVPGYKREIIANAEPLIEEEPLKPWIALRRNMKNVKYFSSMADISFKQRYVYIDVGARNYASSIGKWFQNQYPKQTKNFEIYAIEADKAFHGEYKTKKGVILLPYAAWIRNETLFFEISRGGSDGGGGGGAANKMKKKKRRGMGRIQPVMPLTSYMRDVNRIQGFDFADWLKKTVSRSDFVVVKMDVEGTEFHLIPRLIKTGAMCLVDELFLECHYNRMQRCCPGERSVKYEKTYDQCLDLLKLIRESGVLVHQWW